MSNVEFVLNAVSRSDAGKGASRRLRHAGMVPAIIYGGEQEPTSISLEHREVIHRLSQEAFYSHILTVKLGGQEVKAVLKDVQRHPYKPVIMHLDLQRVSANEKLHMFVPLHFINEATAPGVKAGGKVSHVMTSVEVTCLANDLPEFIEVDLVALQIGQSIHLSDLKLPKGVDLVELHHGEDHNLTVALIPAPRGGAEEAAAE